jgi:phenylalanyl-tRNA synthetase beta subunit
LVPNLIEAAVANLRYMSEVAIFEVGATFHSGPHQATMLAALLTGEDGLVLFRRAKGLLDQLTRLGHLSPINVGEGVTARWADPSARLCLFAGDTPAGTLGLLTKRSRRLAGLNVPHAACIEIDLSALAVQPSRDNSYQPVPNRPGAEFDLSVVIADTVPWATIEASARHADALVVGVDFIDEFRGAWVAAEHRSVTLRVHVRSIDGPLTGDMISQSRAQVLRALAVATGAHLRQ